jgi:uncharacterized protein YegL
MVTRWLTGPRGRAVLAVGLTLASVLSLITVRAQDQSKCSVVPAKVAAPAEILLGQTVRVTLTLSADCPPEVAPVDVLLVIDQSNSMANDKKLVNAKGAALAFLDAMDLSVSRVGLVAFNQDAGLRSQLTHEARPIELAINSLIPGGLTNVSGAIDLARQELQRDPRGYGRFMIVLTDGFNTVPADPIPVAAARAKDDGITVITVCAGGNCDPSLKDAASQERFYFNVADPSELADLYLQLAGEVQANGIAELTIRDQVPANMRYLDGSAVPAAEWDEPSRTLTWRLAGALPPEGLSYELEPLEVGTHPTNVVASGDFKDRRGLPGSTEFPVPRVRVIGPGCAPTPLEIYFLIDDSNCLAGATLDGEPAIVAIRKGVAKVLDQVALGRDQAAVIGFGDVAVLFQDLTTSREAVLAGVDRIAMRDDDARLDLALLEVRKNMGLNHRPGAQVVTITVTDGPMMDALDYAEQIGFALRRQGVKHYAIGIGPLAQHSTLRAISEPGGYRDLRFGGSVIQSYTELGGLIVQVANTCAAPTAVPTAAPTATESPRPNTIWLPDTLRNDG